MYLSKIHIKNYKGIQSLEVNFHKNINVIIGENGCGKSALIDAIRLLYNLSNQKRDIYVNREDFFIDPISKRSATEIEISYEFKNLSSLQKGAFYEYMVHGENEDDDYAKVTIVYEYRKDRAPIFTYSTGDVEGQKAEYRTFELFQHYYLGALRDSTADLLNTRNNILGAVIKRVIERKGTEQEFTDIITETNQKLLEKTEVTTTRDNVNNNLNDIFKAIPENNIGLLIEQSKIEYIVNVIKPFLPHDKRTLEGDGLNLRQNSLGYNNLIYIATVLSDIADRIEDDKNSHYTLLIEEPEAHLHPQLQLSLYNFLQTANKSDSTQLFITSHSPTLTSKVSLDNLIVLEDQAFTIANCFNDRGGEGIIQDTTNQKALTNQDFLLHKKMIERYVDVTRSQIFFAKGVLLVEGISEELLIHAFCALDDYKLEDYRIEMVQTGTSFYPYLQLFNSQDEKKRLKKKVSVLTDDDRFTGAKKKRYSFDRLFENNFERLDELRVHIQGGTRSTRINNLESMSVHNRDNIVIKCSYQTFEFDLIKENCSNSKSDIFNNQLFTYIELIRKDKFDKVKAYIESIQDEQLNQDQQLNIAILLWKSLPSKSTFAQEFAIQIRDNLASYKDNFNIPTYIKEALDHLKS